jgi:hypothetical protein
MELGVLVKNKFFRRPGRYAPKVRQSEERTTGADPIEVRVLAYPEFFAKEMDEIIKQYFGQQ